MAIAGLLSAAAPIVSSIAGAFGGGGAPAGPNITGPGNFRVGGLTVGAKVIGSGRATSDQSTKEAAQVASQPSVSGPDSGYSAINPAVPPSASATAWYQQPGVMLAAVLAVALVVGLLIKRAMSRKDKPAAAAK
jgi:hypothetical protein